MIHIHIYISDDKKYKQHQLTLLLYQYYFEDRKDQPSEEFKNRHRFRQRHFLTECMRTHKVMGHRWLLLIDSDEFIANNDVFYGEGQSSLMRNDQTLYEYLENPSAPTPISVYDMRNETCYLLPRLLFSAVEEEDPENSVHGDIKGFDPKKFLQQDFFIMQTLLIGRFMAMARC